MEILCKSTNLLSLKNGPCNTMLNIGTGIIKFENKTQSLEFENFVIYIHILWMRR